jgi:hypothetical protein
LLPAHPARANERKRNVPIGGRTKDNGEIADLKKQLTDLAADVLDGTVERGKGPVVNQIYGTLIRVLEQERTMRELEELAGRIAELEEVLRGRRARY